MAPDDLPPVLTRRELALLLIIIASAFVLCWGTMLLAVPFGVAWIAPVFSWVGGWAVCIVWLKRQDLR